MIDAPPPADRPSPFARALVVAFAALAAVVAGALGCGSGGGGGAGDARLGGSGLAPVSLEDSTLVFVDAPDVVTEFGASRFTRTGPGGLGGVDGEMFEIGGAFGYVITGADTASLSLNFDDFGFVDGENVQLASTPPQTFVLTFEAGSDTERSGSAFDVNAMVTTGFTLTGDFSDEGGDQTPPRVPPEPFAPETLDGRTVTVTGPGTIGAVAVRESSPCEVLLALPDGGSLSIDGDCGYVRTSDTAGRLTVLATTGAVTGFDFDELTIDATLELSFDTDDSGSTETSETMTVRTGESIEVFEEQGLAETFALTP